MTDVALDPFDANGIYVSTDDPVTFNIGHLHKSTNRGATWNYLDQRGGFIWPHRQNPQVVRMIQSRYQYAWLSTNGIWESTAGGAAGSWVQKSSVSGWSGGWSTAYWAFNASSNHGAVSADLSDAETVLWAGSQFAYASFDGGANAQQIFSHSLGGTTTSWKSRGLDNVVIVDLAVNEANPNEIYAGFWDLGTWCSLDGGASWIPRNEPNFSGTWNGAGGNTFTLETDPARPGVVWATQAAGHSGGSVLLRSTDSGATWPVVASGLPTGTTPHYLGLSGDRGSPIANRTLYITAAGNVYGSTDDGLTWQLRFANGGLHFTAVDRHDRTIVYAGGQAGFWRSTASGAAGTWTEVGTPTMRGTVSGQPTAFNWVGVHGIASDPSIPGRVYAAVHGTGKGLFRSPNNGATWEPMLLPDNHLRDVAVDPADSNTVLVASSSAWNAGGYQSDSNGVWVTGNGGASWSQRNEGLTWPFASAIAFGPAGSASAFIGSPGTGIHRRVSPTLLVSDDQLGAASGGSLQLSVNAGAAHGNASFILAASASGTSPGIVLQPGLVFPLNYDPVLELSYLLANTPVFTNTLGVLDPNGAASASFNVNPNVLAPLIGKQLSFAVLTFAPLGFTSNAITVFIAP